MAGGAEPGTTVGPYFFLSYAHTPKLDPNDSADPDYWVGELYKDLCRDILQMTTLPFGADAGFMDRELQLGNEWPDALGWALATCRVFVPLYSPRYFASEHCGREWFAFSRRAASHAARVPGRVEAIIPALWVPVEPGHLPEAARSIQFDSFGSRTAARGFYEIIKLSRYREDYQEAVLQLAKRIKTIAEDRPVPPGPAADYDELQSAFGRTGPVMQGAKRLRITIVAPRRDDVPVGRDVSRYGQRARDWNPYYPDSVRPLADLAATLVRSLSYRPDVGDLYDHAAELLRDRRPAGPQILIVDPWALREAECKQVLRQLDSMDKPWVQVVIVWNQRDGELAEAGETLRALKSTLRRRLSHGRLEAFRGVSSLDAFSAKLPGVIALADRYYLRRAEAFPPEGPVTE